MHSELVPPVDPKTWETPITNTESNSIQRKIKLSLLKSGICRKFRSFPYVLWLSDKHDKNKK
jgi:hypothetical protein